MKPTKKPIPTEGERIAQVHGLIAGMRDEFDRATKALDEIKRRSDAAIGYELLSESRKHKLCEISAELIAIRGTVTDLWRAVDGIIDGVTESEQEIEL